MDDKELVDIIGKIKVNLKGDDISDVIFCVKVFGKVFYYNTASHKMSKELEKVIRDKHFLVFNNRRNNKKLIPNGIYVTYNEEYDILVFSFVCFRFGRWHEVQRTAMSREAMATMRISDKDYKLSYFDICGQMIIGVKEITKYNYDNNFPFRNFIQDVVSPQTLAKLANYFSNKDTGKVCLPSGYSSDYSRSEYIKNFLYHCSVLGNHHEYLQKVHGNNVAVDALNFSEELRLKPVYRIRYNKNDCFISPVSLDINENARWIIEQSVCDTIASKQWISKEKPFIAHSFPQMMFSYLANIDGEAILRRFYIAFLFGSINGENPEVIAVEEDPVCIKSSGTFNSNYGIIIGADKDLKGSFIEHTSSIVYQWIDYIKSYVCSLRSPFNNLSYSSLETLEISFKKETGIEPDMMIEYSIMLAKYPHVEKILNANYDKRLKTILISNLSRHNFRSSGVSLLSHTLGELDESGDTLNKILQMPKGMFEYMAENEMDFNRIRNLKEIFLETDEGKEYFLRMNRNDYKELICETSALAGSNDADIYECIGMLVVLKGPKRWKEYIQVVKNMLYLRCLGEYQRYIYLLLDLEDTNEDINGLSWRFSTKGELSNAMEHIEYVQSLMEVEKACGTNTILSGRLRELRKYEYRTDEFLVTYPKTVMEMVREGDKLHHCVKQFVKAMIDGDTDILFIREADNPHEPFFTLEIRNNKIRQCHGFSNRNVKAGSSLDRFLVNFCKEKNVGYSLGDDRLGLDLE